MTVQEFINATLLMATGKASNLSVGQTKYTKILAIGNRMQRMWESEPDVDWESTYDYISSGTIANTAEYEIDTEEIRKVSQREYDDIRIVKDDSEWSYRRVMPSQFEQMRGNGVCTIKQGKIVFDRTFEETDEQYGGTILVPGYQRLEALTTSTQEILVDDTEWLVAMSAGEYVRNDITKQNQYPNLVAIAQNIMAKMKENNQGQDSGVEMEQVVMGESW